MGDDKKERGRSRVKTPVVNSNVLEEPNLKDVNESIKKAITKIENLTNIVEFNAKSCEESFKAFEFVQEKITDRINEIVNEFDTIKEVNKNLEKDNIRLKATVTGLSKKVDNFDRKFEEMERETRRPNLCIDGVVEREGLNLLVLVNDLFRDLEIDLRAEDVCQSIYRKGKAAEVTNDVVTKPRPIIVRFKDPNVKGLIFKNLRKLTGNNTWANVFINDDLTPDQIIKMKDMRAIHYHAKSLGRNTKLKGTNLFIDDRRYGLDEISEVPTELSIEKAKNIDIEEGKGLIFQGHHSRYSNMAESEFTYEGRGFKSAEVAYQTKRAETNGQDDLAKNIRKCEDAYKAKRMTKKIIDNEAWKGKKEKVMKEIIKAKFSQNESLKKKLVETKGKKLCEGTGDKFWGCGIPIARATSVKLQHLPGKNTLGKILMEVRSELSK